MWWGTAIEAPDPGALARFYSELLGWTIGHEEPGTTILAADADLVTAPLLDGGEPDARLVELVGERFRGGTLAVAPRLRSSAR